MWDGLQDTKLAGERYTVEISLTTVDGECTRLEHPPVSCIKIDVEGAESKVLKAQRNWQRERPYIVLKSSETFLRTGPTRTLGWIYAESHGYNVMALENLSPVAGIHILKLHMLYTQMFLLVSQAAVM